MQHGRIFGSEGLTRAVAGLAVLLPALAFAAVLVFFLRSAPATPNPNPAGQAVIATQIATRTPGASPTRGPSPTLGPPPTPTPTMTPDLNTPERDQRRIANLERVRDALGKYYQDNHDFPSTGINTQTLCAYEQLDAGCKLTAYLGELPSDLSPPNYTYPYRYTSDGQSYTVWVQLELPSPQPDCPSFAQSGLSSADHVYCLSMVAPQ